MRHIRLVRCLFGVLACILSMRSVAGGQSVTWTQVPPATGSSGTTSTVIVDYAGAYGVDEFCDPSGFGGCTYVPYDYRFTLGTFALLVNNRDRTRIFTVTESETCGAVGGTFNAWRCDETGHAVGTPVGYDVPGKDSIQVNLNGSWWARYVWTSSLAGSVVATPASVTMPGGTTPQSVGFTFTNNGSAGARFFLKATCTGGGISTSPACSPTMQEAYVPSGATVPFRVAFSTNATAGSGTVQLRVVSPLDTTVVVSSATANVTVNSPLLTQVSVLSFQRGTVFERALCPTFAIVPGVATQCGATRVAHALPSVRTFGKSYTPTLAYYGDGVRGAFITTQINLLPATSIPDSVLVNVYSVSSAGVRGPLVSTRRYNGGSNGGGWGPTRKMRVTTADLGIPSDPRGDILQYDVEVQIKPVGSGWVSAAPVVRGRIAVVNRTTSGFGNGWTMLGVEQLVPTQLAGTMLWIDGDGSTRQYVQARVSGVTTVYGAASLDRPDTLFYRSDSNEYRRALPHGANVYFDNLGRHVRTVNRFGRVTSFVYEAGATGRLMSMTVPGGLVYAISYANAAQVTISQLGRTVQLNRTLPSWSTSIWLVSSIVDPNGAVESFTYAQAGSSGAALTAWTDSRGTASTFTIEGGQSASMATSSSKVVQPRVMNAQVDSIVITRLSTTPGRNTAAVAAEDASTADYTLDGPRTDVSDSAYMWTDSIGAVFKTQDAIGRQTLIEHGDPRFPALPTRVVNTVNGFEVRSSYDAQGRMIAKVQINPHNDGRDAVSTYRWDPVWDDLTYSTLPEGEASRDSVDVTKGNRVWEENPFLPGSRTNYSYDTQGRVIAVQLPTAGGLTPIDSVTAFDALGNATSLRSSMGYRTLVANDVYGRTVAVRSQITPGDQVNMQLDSTVYDIMGRAKQKYTWGPAMNNSPAQWIQTTNFYNLDGSVESTERRTGAIADTLDVVRALVNRWRYDAFGRVIVEIAPDQATDSVLHDPAGNEVARRTRRGDLIQATFDALNRMMTRTVPARAYGSRTPLLCQFLVMSNPPPCTTETIPQYPLSAGNATTVAAVTTSIVYDAATGLPSYASTPDALTYRWYDRSGALSSERQMVRTVAGAFWTGPGLAGPIHGYDVGYAYDRDGRIVSTTLPSQLQPKSNAGAVLGTQILYSYDDAAGSLAKVQDPLGNAASVSYNVRGERTALQMPGASVTEIRDASGAVRRITAATTGAGVLVQDTLTYDARGKLLSRLSQATSGPRDALRARYNGLGYLIGDSTSSQGQNTEVLAYNTSETFVPSAFGDVLRSSVTSTLTSYNTGLFEGGAPFLSSSSGNATVRAVVFDSVTGRMKRSVGYSQRDTTLYDGAGSIYYSAIKNLAGQVPWYQERASFLDGDGRLRATDLHIASEAGASGYRRTFEEYGYDAFGRRVWVRARNYCNDSDVVSGNHIYCDVGVVRRIVWDGQAMLGEIQVPGDNAAPADSMERDGVPAALPLRTGLNYDANPFFGTTLYAHGLVGVDQPHAVIRLNYRTWSSGVLQRWEPFAVSLLWSADGRLVNRVYTDGSISKTSYSQTHRFLLPNSYFAYYRAQYRASGWNGSLPEDKRDASGLHDRRNRAYDPMSGRFTQEDPIGLAGGLNLYGYANGDPVNFSDPFGTCPVFLAAVDGPLPIGDVIAGIICLGEAAVGLRTLFAALENTSSRAARRSVMRAQGIPTSQQPDKQRCDDKGNRQYEYSTEADATKVVTHHADDANHPNPHWEAGTQKPVEQYGETPNSQSRYFNNDPKSGKPKSTCDYKSEARK